MFYLSGWRVFCLHFYQVIRVLLMVFMAVLSAQPHALAIDIDEISVTEKDGIYHIYISAEIAAEEKYVRRVLVDYVHVYRLNSLIIESKVFDTAIKGSLEIQSLLLFCNPIACKEVKRVDVISTLDSGELQAVIVPEKSDFRSGKALWKIIPMGNRTRLTYFADIEPDFFILPVLGTNMVINNIRNEFSKTLVRIEKIALIEEEREWQNDGFFIPITSRAGVAPCRNMPNADL